MNKRDMIRETLDANPELANLPTVAVKKAVTERHAIGVDGSYCCKIVRKWKLDTDYYFLQLIKL